MDASAEEIRLGLWENIGQFSLLVLTDAFVGAMVGLERRGLALWLKEFAGYLAVGFTAWITGYIASIYTLRPHPFYLGIGVAFAGLIFSLFFDKETRGHALFEARLHVPQATPIATATDPSPTARKPSQREIFGLFNGTARPHFPLTGMGLRVRKPPTL